MYLEIVLTTKYQSNKDKEDTKDEQMCSMQLLMNSLCSTLCTSMFE